MLGQKITHETRPLRRPSTEQRQELLDKVKSKISLDCGTEVGYIAGRTQWWCKPEMDEIYPMKLGMHTYVDTAKDIYICDTLDGVIMTSRFGH